MALDPLAVSRMARVLAEQSARLGPPSDGFYQDLATAVLTEAARVPTVTPQPLPAEPWWIVSAPTPSRTVTLLGTAATGTTAAGMASTELLKHGVGTVYVVQVMRVAAVS
jgi:hypothetical protein